MPDEVSGKKISKFSPMIDRHFQHFGVQSVEDIKAGHEILDNYLPFTSDERYWEADVIALRNMCSGAAGDVTNYERKRVN